MSRPVVPTELVAPIYDPRSFGERSNVEAVLARLRKEHPLSVAEVPGYDPYWIVTKYDDVREISRQDDIFHSGDRQKTLAPIAAEQMVLEYTGGKPAIFRTLTQMDAPDHPEYREVAAPALSPKAVSQLDALIRRKAKQYVDKMEAAGGEMDFAHDLAYYYPLDVICTLIGIPPEDHEKTLRLSQWLFNYADPDLKRPGADMMDPTEITKTWSIINEEWGEYFTKMIADRRACPRDDIASLLSNAKIGGCPMADRETISYFVIASSAGHDTTAATTGTGMWQIARNPQLLERLKAEPKLIMKFVEESIRWATPVQHFIRSAAEDYEIKGRLIRKGDLVYLSYLSANRDEDQFEDPFTFNPDRWPNRHIGFGYGRHVCLGQHLAREEVKAFWDELIPRLESVEMAGEGKLAQSEFVSGPKSIPIRYRFKN
ncbi:cytochrome P450 [soil metagenome]